MNQSLCTRGCERQQGGVATGVLQRHFGTYLPVRAAHLFFLGWKLLPRGQMGRGWQRGCISEHAPLQAEPGVLSGLGASKPPSFPHTQLPSTTLSPDRPSCVRAMALTTWEWIGMQGNRGRKQMESWDWTWSSNGAMLVGCVEGQSLGSLGRGLGWRDC